MLSRFYATWGGWDAVTTLSHTADLTFYCEVLEAARSFSCSNASHSSSVSMYTLPEQ